MKDLYENTYQNKKHFSFGKNWQLFLESLNTDRINNAKKSLSDFLGKNNIKGKSFVDIGCGSGLFSLSAYKLGAKKVVSVDVDQFSLACVSQLKQNESNPKNWEIKKGSALDLKFLQQLGQFDIVYSWGVLHHTGDMYQALMNVSNLVNKKGKLYLAIYNDNQIMLEGTSQLWVKLKKFYNQNNFVVKKIVEILYILYYVIGLIAGGKNPIGYIRNYKTLRGMNFWTDIKDWLGGYPYEYATTVQIVDYFGGLGFKCTKLNPARSIGCNEFLLERK